MTFFLSDKSLDHMEGVHDELEAVCHRALALSSIDFGIPSTGGLRTAREQQALYQLGKSKRDGFIRLSEHQSGNALDFYAYVDGRASWDEYHLTTVAAAFLQAASELGVKLQWGGHWRGFTDMPHVQRSD